MKFAPAALVFVFLNALWMPCVKELRSPHELSQPITHFEASHRRSILSRLGIDAALLRAEAEDAGAQRIVSVQATGIDHCGAVGNCSLWIFDSNGNLLLDTIAQTVAYLSTEQDGKRDILTGQHVSASESFLQRFRYDGSKYRLTDCVQVRYSHEDRLAVSVLQRSRVACRK